MSCCGALTARQMGKKLESMGAAPGPPHLRNIDRIIFSFFFFMFPDLRQFGPIRVDSGRVALVWADSHQFRPSHASLASI